MPTSQFLHEKAMLVRQLLELCCVLQPDFLDLIGDLGNILFGRKVLAFFG